MSEQSPDQSLNTPVGYKGHVISSVVNELTEVARKYHAQEQLRQRISTIIAPLLEGGPLEVDEVTPHTLAGFRAVFYDQHHRHPTEQEIWNAAIKSWRDLHPESKSDPLFPFNAYDPASFPGYRLVKANDSYKEGCVYKVEHSWTNTQACWSSHTTEQLLAEEHPTPPAGYALIQESEPNGIVFTSKESQDTYFAAQANRV